MHDPNCRYCTGNIDDIAVKVADLETTTLMLVKDQTYKGRCILALKDHKTEVYQLDSGELQSWARDLAKASKALAAAFSPDKINYAGFGDLYPHLHIHLVPKYKDGPSWGGPFVLDLSAEKAASGAELQERAELIRKHL
jgi:diadenosine tetraphosphate (Ap4A) HIT family hydrolase